MKITNPANQGLAQLPKVGPTFMVLRFVLAIEGTIIQMIEPLHFPPQPICLRCTRSRHDLAIHF